MLDGRHGKARQKAMELLVRYAEALGAERFVDTNNVAGVPGLGESVPAELLQGQGRPGRYDAIFSYFDLDSDELVDAPQALVHTCHLQGGADPAALGDARRQAESLRGYEEREAFAVEQRRRDPEDLHAVSGRQRAGQRRALRLDGVVGRRSTATRCSARAPTPKGARARARRC